MNRTCNTFHKVVNMLLGQSKMVHRLHILDIVRLEITVGFQIFCALTYLIKSHFRNWAIAVTTTQMNN